MSGSLLPSSYSSPSTTLRRYWQGYGGCKALVTSPYFHAAVVLSIPGTVFAPAGWVEKVVSIVPSLLGLSLAGYAILLALGSGEFFERIKKPKSNNRPSTLEGISTAFLHFVIVQSLALIASLGYASIADGLPALRAFLEDLGYPGSYRLLRTAGGFVGWLGLFYSVACMLALSFRLYRMIQWICHLPSSPSGSGDSSKQ